MKFTVAYPLALISFLLFTLTTFSQLPVKKYETEWKKVEDFVKKNLPQSALTEVKAIYNKAKKEKQDAQVIKALVYMTSLQEETREDNQALSIKELESELPGASHASAAIINSLLAEKYWSYYQENRWDFYDRTETTELKKEDIATWGAEDFHRRIGELYLQSLSNERLLQQTKLQAFDAIIIKGNMRHLRPTLFDLLAHRALDYFENDERDLNRPAYAFEINQAAAFDPASDFIHRKFVTNDSLSLAHKALLLYQRLIAFHLADKQPDALIDVDLRRYQFVREKAVNPNKDQLYFYGVNHIAHQYGETPAATQAWYLVARYYAEQGDGYKPYGDTTHRFAKMKAKEICEQIVAKKDSSEGKINCYNLLNELNAHQLNLEMEKVNLPGQPFRALVDYKNVATAHLRLVKMDANLRKQLENRYSEKFWNTVIAAKPVRAWTQQLPATNDLQKHSVEIKIDALPSGDYLLLFADAANFSNAKTMIGASPFYVSNISFANNGDDFFVLDRNSGQPLVNAAVQVWERTYDYKTSKNVNTKGKSYRTDQNGFFRFVSDKPGNRNSNYLLDITHGNDKLFMDDWMNNYYYRNTAQDKTINHTYFFTDRSIYRPGQTLFFKGIAIGQNSATRRADVLGSMGTTVYLRDANYQVIDSLQVTTNEYGSFSGKFQLPSGGLTGHFTVMTTNPQGSAGIRVEEYKRPKFYVEYEPLKGTYKVNDSIHVTGIAKAYAGNNIDGATVRYRVVREARFPYPWLTRWWFPPSKPLEIVHGETKTDANGHFRVTFTAIPDLGVDPKLEPVFDYVLYADVTDINGETRSGEKRVTAGYKALLLKTDIPSSLSIDSLKTLTIRTENMNGEFEPATVTVRISRLKEEKRLIRGRFWERPDQFVMTKAEYIKAFPYDEYDNETDPASWEASAFVFERSDTTSATIGFGIEEWKPQPGFYKIEISTTDKDGKEVKTIEHIELYRENSKQLNKPEYLWFNTARAVEPGKSASIGIGTSADHVFLVQQVDRSNENGFEYSFLRLNNEKKTLSLPVTEADRGGFAANWLFVKHNRVYQRGQVVDVPWTNKELKIEYATYRDKTLPGSGEKWKLRISGRETEQLAAELLVSMYDASLDQFYPHQWSKPSIWPTYSWRNSWNGGSNFAKVETFIKWNTISANPHKELIKVYDQLIFDEFSGQSDFMRNRGYATKFTTQMLDGRIAGFALDSAESEITLGYATIPTPPANSEKSADGNNPDQDPSVQVRKNFNETAFFFPDLHIDESGAIEFSFTMPEALTKWKFQAFAHTKQLAMGYSQKEIVTQKQLMVQPNAPRFMREGDKILFSAKIVNLGEQELSGNAEFQLFDAATNEPLGNQFKLNTSAQAFKLAAGQSAAVIFPIEIPADFKSALTWRIIARATSEVAGVAAVSDGEEASLPILSNRMLVTETLPLPMRGNGTKEFKFDKLVQSGNSQALQHQSLTIEYTSNPAWYAVQALPYLMEYPYECAEQNWNRYYANSLASMIANSSPRIREVFEKWKNTDTAALLSNLQKNPELKNILLEETPWVLQAKSETEQKKNIALLFDMMRMSAQLAGGYEKLKQMQSSNGGFVWFKGGPDDRYITQYIVTGIGHLLKLNAVAAGQDENLKEVLASAIPYLDRKIKEDYDQLVKNKTDLEKYVPGSLVIQYFYMRSFFPDRKIASASQAAYNYFMSRLPLTWTQQNKYMQGMVALALHRSGNSAIPAAILKSLKETSINNEELGMYWKDAGRSWWWYESPIERQALLIEAFHEITKDPKTVDDLRTWLLRNKQTNRWESTKATAEACYALILQGSNWIAAEPSVKIKLGNTTLSPDPGVSEAGTGYFTGKIDGKDVKSDMGNVSVTVNAPGQGMTTWGAVYWQYFENLDKITTAKTPLQLDKKLFVEKNTDRGPVLTPVKENDKLKTGDKIKVRIELRVDRDMEYVHMKDMRASALEPVNVLSGYNWQGGLGYYESTRDASTNFFFSSLRKGTYVFEYTLFVTHSGNFSNGVTSIQCMYAPEFSAHSEGVRITVE